MKNNSSVWEKKVMAFTLQWRWVITFGAALQIWSVAQHYKVHDVTSWSLLPSAWVLTWLTMGVMGNCVFAAGIWIMYLHKPRPRK